MSLNMSKAWSRKFWFRQMVKNYKVWKNRFSIWTQWVYYLDWKLYMSKELIDLKRIGVPNGLVSKCWQVFAPKLRDAEMDLKTDFDAASNKEKFRTCQTMPGSGLWTRDLFLPRLRPPGWNVQEGEVSATRKILPGLFGPQRFRGSFLSQRQFHCWDPLRFFQSPAWRAEELQQFRLAPFPGPQARPIITPEGSTR